MIRNLYYQDPEWQSSLKVKDDLSYGGEVQRPKDASKTARNQNYRFHYVNIILFDISIYFRKGSY